MATDSIFIYDELSQNGMFIITEHNKTCTSKAIRVYSNVQQNNKFIKIDNKLQRFIPISWKRMLIKLNKGVFYYYNINDDRLNQLLSIAPNLKIERLVKIISQKNDVDLRDVELKK